MSTQLKDTLFRSVRTFFQAWAGVLLGQAALLLFDMDDGEIDWILWKRVMLSGIAAGIIAMVTFLHNLGEDHNVIPTLLKPKDRALGDAVMGDRP